MSLCEGQYRAATGRVAWVLQKGQEPIAPPDMGGTPPPGWVPPGTVFNRAFGKGPPGGPKVNQPPEVPATPFEPERNLTVLQEIRQKNLRTKQQVQDAFPKSQLSREAAAALLKQAWGPGGPSGPGGPGAGRDGQRPDKAQRSTPAGLEAKRRATGRSRGSGGQHKRDDAH